MQPTPYLAGFDKFFRDMVIRTCKEWDYPIPDGEYYNTIYERLPFGLQSILSYGLSKGLIEDVGLSNTKSAGFRPHGISEDKGPYSWFERDSAKKQPRPCWEYYVHLSEFVRLYQSFKSKNIELKFEDNYMDIGLYKNNKLWVCCEIKVTSKKAEGLIREITQYQTVSEIPPVKRGNDSVSKAHYIHNFKPEYFYVVYFIKV